jgi:thiamine biosynthesis lipoprotein
MAAFAPGRVQPRRTVRVEEVMGIPVSIHVLNESGRIGRVEEEAIAGCFADLRRIDRLFSTYRPDSDISLMARGLLALEDADPLVRKVEAACRAVSLETGGLFRADWGGRFDPTGYVKGWAVERAARAHLAPLVSPMGSAVAVGINAGGDMQLFTAPDHNWTWTVAIADPRQQGQVLATLEVVDGAVATSGPGERGAHIIDPRTERPATGVLSATVVADSLTRADVWATAAVVAGPDDRSWVRRSGSRTGLVLAADGRITRWLDGVPIDVVPTGGALV